MRIEEARKLFEEYVKSDKIKLHCREVEVIMKALAKEFGENEEKWEIAGLLHDMDCDVVLDIKQQGKKVVEILKEKTDSQEDICHAILAHNEENLGIKRESKFDYALSAADNISGIIYAYALMKKSIDKMDVAGLKKRLKDKRFAATVRRDLIYGIEETGISLDKFLEISIKAVKEIKEELGLS